MIGPEFPRFYCPDGRGVADHPAGLLYHRRDVDAYLATLPDPAAIVRAALEAAATHVESIGHFGPKETGHTLATDFRAIATDPAAVAEIVAKVKAAGE
jgi:hypothetical protein